MFDVTLENYGQIPAEEEPMGLINGRIPGSREEWRVAKALWTLDVEFQYQKTIRGGTLLRGGQVLDFLLFVPFAQPAQVYGEYWHKGEISNEERLKLSVIEQEYGREAYIWWGKDLEDDEEALATVKKDLRL